MAAKFNLEDILTKWDEGRKEELLDFFYDKKMFELFVDRIVVFYCTELDHHDWDEQEKMLELAKMVVNTYTDEFYFEEYVKGC